MDVDDTNSIETESVEVGFEAKVDRIPIAASCPAFRYYSSLPDSGLWSWQPSSRRPRLSAPHLRAFSEKVMTFLPATKGFLAHTIAFGIKHFHSFTVVRSTSRQLHKYTKRRFREFPEVDASAARVSDCIC
jgi:hypothetical protein